MQESFYLFSDTMHNRILQTICLLALLLISFIGCSKDDIIDHLSLRSSKNETLYWDNNAIASKRVESIMYNNEDGVKKYERFKIVHISDPHLSDKSPSNHYINPFNLKQAIQFANQQELRINAIAATGDFISNSDKKRAILFLKSFISNFYYENYIPSFLCTGNHDCNAIESISNSFIYQNELHQILFAQNSLKTDASKNYYYSDVPNPQGGYIRFIALDMIDQPGNEYNTLKYASFTKEQVDWLGNIALKEGMTNQHSIVILEHFPFQRYNANATTYLCDGDFVHSWNMIPEIIEAYRSRTTLTKTYPNKLSKGKDISVDFDFTNSKGEFVCYLGGHSHITTYFNVDGLENEDPSLLPQKMLLCTNLAPSEKGVVYNRVERTEDNLSSNSFNIYAIDTKEKKIYITFFGAYKPSDQPDYPEIQSIAYQ